MDVIGTKVFKSFPPCYSQSYLPTDFTPPALSKGSLKLVCNVNIVYGNLKSENFQIIPETSTKLYVHEFGFWSCLDNVQGAWLLIALPITTPATAFTAVKHSKRKTNIK